MRFGFGVLLTVIGVVSAAHWLSTTFSNPNLAVSPQAVVAPPIAAKVQTSPVVWPSLPPVEKTPETGPAKSAVVRPEPVPPRKQTHTAEKVLTAAAIAALIVTASRSAYHARGKPCACPDDAMRNGRSCGHRSAYSRPGGAAPLCYPHDVTAKMIEEYRSRQASR